MRSVAHRRAHVKTGTKESTHDLRTTTLLTQVIEDVAWVVGETIALDFADATADGTMNGDAVHLSRRIKVSLDVLKTLGDLAYESWPTD